MTDAKAWLVGGLGAPYDGLLAAALRGIGQPVSTLGPMDRDAHDRGRAALPRGPCAPLLYTTGALLRTAEQVGSARYVGVSACGPCRFAAFPLAWRRALSQASCSNVEVTVLAQDLDVFAGALGDDALERLVTTIAVGDALVELVRRLRPHVVDLHALDRAARHAVLAMMRVLEAGAAPLVALRAVRRFHAELALRPSRAMGRIALIGEPWSLHTAGSAQLHVPEILGAAGLEVEVPPLALWLALRAWERRRGADGRPAAPSEAEALDALVRGAARGAARALGMQGLDVPDLDELEALAGPHLPREIRGGYGFVEIGLAIRAARARRAHAVVSLKSFGCIPSSGLADAITPVALARETRRMPFLSLEVSSDGEAARESRLMLRASAAQEEAEGELATALERSGRDPRRIEELPRVDVRDGGPPVRPYACTLACAVAQEGASA